MPSKTRSEYIAILKTRGKRGKLSKMRKADLKRLVEESEPPMHPDSGRDENETDQHGSGAHTKHGSGLTLDPDPRAQGGGHYFQSFGETAASQKRKYKHEHEKSSMPTSNKQRGSGKHDYRDFVAAKMRQNGGNMKAAVAEWREQSGGHMVRTDGTISAKEDSKYAHEHKNTPNPAKGASASGESVASEAAAPAPKATPPAKKATPAAKKRPPAAKKRAPRGDQSIFDGPAPDPTPPAARASAASAASADDGPETDDTPAARREPERNSERRRKAVQAAKDRLKADKYSGTKARFNKYWDQRTVELNRRPKQASVAADYDRYKRSVARIEEDRASARLERENREAVNRMDVERSWDRTDALPAVPRRTRQSDQDGAGMLDDIASWRNKMHKDHPFLSDMVEGGLAAGATIATGGLAEAGLGAVAGEEMVEGGVTGIASRALDSAASRATGAVDRLAAGASRPAIEDGALPGLQQSLVNRGAAYVKSGIEKWKGEAAKQLGVEGVTTGLKDEIDQEEADEAATEAANAPKPSQPVYHASDADAYAQNYNALMAPSEGRSILG